MRKDKFDLFIKILTTESFTPEQWEEVLRHKAVVRDEGVQGKHISKEKEQLVRKMLENNESPTKIAKACGVSRQTVYRYIDKIEGEKQRMFRQEELDKKRSEDLLQIFNPMIKNIEDTGVPF